MKHPYIAAALAALKPRKLASHLLTVLALVMLPAAAQAALLDRTLVTFQGFVSSYSDALNPVFDGNNEIRGSVLLDPYMGLANVDGNEYRTKWVRFHLRAGPFEVFRNNAPPDPHNPTTPDIQSFPHEYVSFTNSTDVMRIDTDLPLRGYRPRDSDEFPNGVTSDSIRILADSGFSGDLFNITSTELSAFPDADALDELVGRSVLMDLWGGPCTTREDFGRCHPPFFGTVIGQLTEFNATSVPQPPIVPLPGGFLLLGTAVGAIGTYRLLVAKRAERRNRTDRLVCL